MTALPNGSPRSVLPQFRSDRAISLEFSHNLIIQALVVGMVAVTLWITAPGPNVIAWAATVMIMSAAEDQVLRAAVRHPGFARAANFLAPALRIATTAVYALAALILISKGEPASRLFAFALMACSMVYVLMRYYRSPWIFVASISPYIAVIGLVTWELGAKEFAQGHALAASAAGFTIAIFGLLFWSARRQLSASWIELLNSRHDAEERERAAEAANRAKSHFLTTMSHELRTPLNGVLGMAQALSHDGLTKAQGERVRVIRRSGESLLAVLNDLLDLSKIEASALELELAEFDLVHMARGVVAAFRPEARKKGLDFDFEITGDAEGRYRGDAARIKRILYNLSANAVKFTEAGGILLTIDRQDGELILKVADSGIGIAAEHRERLFDDFFQADASLTRRHGGSGLGLAICRQLTGLMGGSITVDSAVGKGSVFTVLLPLERIACAVEQEAECVETAQTESAELRVLAAEDNDTNRLVLKTLLAQAGISPFFVVNGLEAVAAWERQEWDVVLMDIQMPEMDGLEATHAIRARERETGRARTPIIALTANAMTHQVKEYLAAGMEAVVPKPIDLARLFSTLEQVLDGTGEDQSATQAA